MRDTVYVICAAVVMVVAIAAVTVLEVTGHGEELRSLIFLIGPYVSGLVTLGGIELRGRSVKREVTEARADIVTEVRNGQTGTVA